MKIKVEPLLPTGNFLNCRIGVERDYPDDFSLEDAINTEWNNLIAIHMKRYPHLYTEEGKAKYEMYKGEDEFRGTHIKDIKEEKVSDAIQASLNEINKCETLDELQHCWIMSKGNLTLSAAWKQKEKQIKG